MNESEIDAVAAAVAARLERRPKSTLELIAEQNRRMPKVDPDGRPILEGAAR